MSPPTLNKLWHYLAIRNTFNTFIKDHPVSFTTEQDKMLDNLSLSKTPVKYTAAKPPDFADKQFRHVWRFAVGHKENFVYKTKSKFIDGQQPKLAATMMQDYKELVRFNRATQIMKGAGLLGFGLAI